MTFTLPNRNRLKHHVATIAATATLVLAGCANYSGIKSDKTLTQPQQLETSQSIPAEAGQCRVYDAGADARRGHVAGHGQYIRIIRLVDRAGVRDGCVTKLAVGGDQGGADALGGPGDDGHLLD